MIEIYDTSEAECLVQSLFEAVKATNKETKAREEYDGYSWGYHGHYIIKEREDAMKDFAERLNKVIDKRVDERIKQLTLNQDQ